MTRTMLTIENFDAVVFDLDGTLIDSAPDIRAAINDVLAADGLPPIPLPLITSFIGHGVAKLVDRAYRHRDIELDPDSLEATVERFVKIYGNRCTILTHPFPGAAEGLEALDRLGLKLGVCTNKPQALAKRILLDLDLARFCTVVVGGDSCDARKPSPEPLLACLDALGAERSQSLYIGDSETDVQTARAARVPVLVVSHGYAGVEADQLGADGVIDRIDRWVDAMTG